MTRLMDQQAFHVSLAQRERAYISTAKRITSCNELK